MKKIRYVLFFILGVTATLAVGRYLHYSPLPPNDSEVAQLGAVQQLKNVLKLGVIEVHVSQIYEVRREKLMVYQISVPWTGQKSVIAVKGTAQIGYDLEKAEILSDPKSRKVDVRFPEPTITAMDLDFHFVQEEDSFLRRLTPDDRNKILEAVKIEVKKDLLNAKLKSDIEQRTKDLMGNFGEAYHLELHVSKLLPPS